MVSRAEVDRRLESAAAAEKDRQANAVLFDGLLDKLVAQVKDGYEEKVEAAVADGDRITEVFCFDGSERLEGTDHSILFLAKGPRRQGQDYFLRLGVMPFLPRLYHAVRPFDVSLRYIPEANENIVSLSW